MKSELFGHLEDSDANAYLSFLVDLSNYPVTT